MKNKLDFNNVLVFALIIGIMAFAMSNIAAGEDICDYKCKWLKNLKILDTVIIGTTVVKAADGLPEYCRVTGYILPSINFELRLPTSNWNNKFYFAGCGGFCGRIEEQPIRGSLTNSLIKGLKRNYAALTTDSGHWGSTRLDGTWAYNDRQKEIDFGYRAVHEVTRVAKEFIKAYYDKPPAYSYFEGCSNGGRQAIMEAIRYPDDFDGIISGAPAIDFTGCMGPFFSWVSEVNLDAEGKTILDRSKLKAIIKAVYAECDGMDGLIDGTIDNPRKCSFNSESLLCKGKEADDCLTPAQVATLKKFYEGPKDSSDSQLYCGLPFGSEPFWWLWVIGGEPPGPYGKRSPIQVFKEEFLKYLAFDTDPDISYDLYSFDFDLDTSKLEFMAKILNATNPDLSKFKKRGGKLILYQGLGDAIIPPQRTIDYYESVIKEMGGVEQTFSFFRAFMVPGMDHCAVLPGRGPDRFDPLTPLENWVEKGVAPEQIIAFQLDKEGKVVRTRPLCPYPKVARYKGSGRINDAANFACVEQ